MGDMENKESESIAFVDNPAETSTAPGLARLIAGHYNKLEEVGIEERKSSRIYHMRNFNNWIKSMFIDEQLSIIKKNLEQKTKGTFQRCKALDLCCGKGGDLKKWFHGCVAHIIFSDIAETSVEQCKERYKSLRNRNLFSAEFIVADCTRARLREKMEDVTVQLDLVSCQFAFHYSFESLAQAKCMLKNASECLRPGGRFIGTIPNATEIVRRLRKSKGKKIGNDCYSITPQCGEPYPLFGAKYDFQLHGVVNCPEFLVHIPLLVHLAKQFGLKLISVTSLPDFFNEKLSKGKILLERMRALESYPSTNDVPLCGKADQYSHAEKVLGSSSYEKVGTLTSDEWEVISLYMLFVFEKVEVTSYDDKGNPVFNIS